MTILDYMVATVLVVLLVGGVVFLLWGVWSIIMNGL